MRSFENELSLIIKVSYKILHCVSQSVTILKLDHVSSKELAFISADAFCCLTKV